MWMARPWAGAHECTPGKDAVQLHASRVEAQPAPGPGPSKAPVRGPVWLRKIRQQRGAGPPAENAGQGFAIRHHRRDQRAARWCRSIVPCPTQWRCWGSQHVFVGRGGPARPGTPTALRRNGKQDRESAMGLFVSASGPTSGPTGGAPSRNGGLGCRNRAGTPGRHHPVRQPERGQGQPAGLYAAMPRPGLLGHRVQQHFQENRGPTMAGPRSCHVRPTRGSGMDRQGPGGGASPYPVPAS